MDSEVSDDWRQEKSCTATNVSTRTKILAYLGELKPKEFVPVRKLIFDLSLRFTTAKNVLTALEEEWIVEKKIQTTRGTVALFRISTTAVTVQATTTVSPTGVAEMNQRQSCMQACTQACEQRVVPFVPPEWSADYGKHPYGF